MDCLLLFWKGTFASDHPYLGRRAQWLLCVLSTRSGVIYRLVVVHTPKNMYELMFGCNRQVTIAVNTSVITMNIDEHKKGNLDFRLQIAKKNGRNTFQILSTSFNLWTWCSWTSVSASSKAVDWGYDVTVPSAQAPGVQLVNMGRNCRWWIYVFIL